MTTMTEEQKQQMALGYIEMGEINLSIVNEFMKFEGIEYLNTNDK